MQIRDSPTDQHFGGEFALYETIDGIPIRDGQKVILDANIVFKMFVADDIGFS